MGEGVGESGLSGEWKVEREGMEMGEWESGRGRWEREEEWDADGDGRGREREMRRGGRGA